MYAELKVRLYFDGEELANLGSTPRKVVDSLIAVESDSGDELCIVPNPRFMPDDWDVTRGPFTISGGEVLERRLYDDKGIVYSSKKVG